MTDTKIHPLTMKDEDVPCPTPHTQNESPDTPGWDPTEFKVVMAKHKSQGLFLSRKRGPDSKKGINNSSKDKGGGNYSKLDINLMSVQEHHQETFDEDPLVEHLSSHRNDKNAKLGLLIIRMNSTFKIRWDLMIMALSVWNCFSLPVDVAFQPPIF